MVEITIKKYKEMFYNILSNSRFLNKSLNLNQKKSTSSTFDNAFQDSVSKTSTPKASAFHIPTSNFQLCNHLVEH